MSKVKCPGCGREVDQTRYGKYAPHIDPINRQRCMWSGSRVIIEAAKNNQQKGIQQ